MKRFYTWPDWAEDALVIDTDVHFDWRDRLRILFGRQVTVTSKTFTRIVIGEHETMSRVYVAPLRRRIVGMVEQAGPDEPERGR